MHTYTNARPPPAPSAHQAHTPGACVAPRAGDGEFRRRCLAARGWRLLPLHASSWRGLHVRARAELLRARLQDLDVADVEELNPDGAPKA